MLFWLTLNGLLLIIAYLLGSIPSGYWAGRILKGIDIREHGSGSTGATNVLRTIGKLPALVVLLVDISKGAAAIGLMNWVYRWAANTTTPGEVNLSWFAWIVTLVGLLALLGHSKSIFLNFTGGKSVATSLGILLAMNWLVGLGALAVFGVVLAVSRIVSLGSILAAIAVPLLMLATQQPLPYLLFGIAGGIYVIWRHQTNIQRLLAGTEPRIGQKLTVPEPIQETQES
jgi:acyl phosphate:glycerol-3-phosphate acyltransferase